MSQFFSAIGIVLSSLAGCEQLKLNHHHLKSQTFRSAHIYLNENLFSHSPQPFELHVIHEEVSGLHQLVDLLQQLFLSVLLGPVLVCSTVT